MKNHRHCVFRKYTTKDIYKINFKHRKSIKLQLSFDYDEYNENYYKGNSKIAVLNGIKTQIM